MKWQYAKYVVRASCVKGSTYFMIDEKSKPT